MLEGFRDAEGRTSYDVLVDAVSNLARDARVLDLACGDGYLLAQLAARGFSYLSGIDRSPQELTAARVRLGPGIRLHCCAADTLPFLDGSMDVVVCHMALMLMDPVEAVITAITRVLRPGGAFAAVINRYQPDPAFGAFSRELGWVTAEAGLERLRIGSPDLFTERGLRARLGHPRFAEPIALRDFTVEQRTSPGGLWSCFEAMYDVFRLPEMARAALERALLAAWAALASDGQLTAAMGMRLVICRTAGEAGSP
jgi:SAM-dependent methyltransferase